MCIALDMSLTRRDLYHIEFKELKHIEFSVRKIYRFCVAKISTNYNLLSNQLNKNAKWGAPFLERPKFYLILFKNLTFPLKST